MPVLTPSKKMSKRPNLNPRVNLAAWYRYRIGMTNVSGACSSWADQSGNTRPLLQATASARPTILSDGSLSFDGIAQYMQATFTLVQPCTIYLAFQQLSWTSGDGVLDGATGATKVTQHTGSPKLAMDGGSALADDATIALNVPGAIACVFNSTSSVYQAAGGAASVTTTGDASTNNPGGITLGALQAPGNFGNIRVYEMCVYSVAHDAPTRLQVLRYLGRIANVGGIT